MTGAEQREYDDTAEWRVATTNRINDVEIAVRENTRMTTEINTKTDKIVKVFDALEKTGNVFGWVGWVAKNVLIPCAIVIGAIIYFVKTGKVGGP